MAYIQDLVRALSPVLPVCCEGGTLRALGLPLQTDVVANKLVLKALVDVTVYPSVVGCLAGSAHAT